LASVSKAARRSLKVLPFATMVLTAHSAHTLTPSGTLLPCVTPLSHSTWHALPSCTGGTGCTGTCVSAIQVHLGQFHGAECAFAQQRSKFDGTLVHDRHALDFEALQHILLWSTPSQAQAACQTEFSSLAQPMAGIVARMACVSLLAWHVSNKLLPPQHYAFARPVCAMHT